MTDDNSFNEYLQKVNIQEVLQAAGYRLNRKDGIRYPSYVNTDSAGKRIPGDKFIVTRNGQCCFAPPEQRRYNVISFITSFPEKFDDYKPGMNKYFLVHKVCSGILGHPVDERTSTYTPPVQNHEPFDISRYETRSLDPRDRESFKPFYPFFINRGITLPTQIAFSRDFMLASHKLPSGVQLTNLSFPLRIPGSDAIVGLEERGRRKSDGTSYKGMAAGSNSAEGLWMSSPRGTGLDKARNVYWFESAYDAMSYYQLHRKDQDISYGLYVSTGGNPSVGQIRGVIDSAPNAKHHLCFDNDAAGWRFVQMFKDTAGISVTPADVAASRPKTDDPLIRTDLIPYFDSLKSREGILTKVRDILTSRGRKDEENYILSGNAELLPEDFRKMDKAELREALIDYQDIYLRTREFAASMDMSGAESKSPAALLLSGNAELLPEPLRDILADGKEHMKASASASPSESSDELERRLSEDAEASEEFGRLSNIVNAWTEKPLAYSQKVEIIREVPEDGCKDWNDQVKAELEKKNMIQEMQESRLRQEQQQPQQSEQAHLSR